MIKSFWEAVPLWEIWFKIGLQDVRLRYRRSTFGIWWIFLNLMIIVFAIGLIYSRLLGQNLRDFLPFLTIGLISWNYLTSSIVEGGNAFISSEGYIKQIGLPYYIYILRFFVGFTLVLLISLPTYFAIVLAFSLPAGWGMLWAVPGLFLFCTVALFLVAFFAHLNLRFRDTAHIAGAALQVLFFLTPVIWPPEMILKGDRAWVVTFNPIYHLLEVMRRPLLASQPATALNYAVTAGILAVLAVAAGIITRRYRDRITYLL